MEFGGFQKLTLLDFPGVVACTLFTKGCNFLCPFCHNAPLVNRTLEADTISENEVLDYLRKRRGILEGICITGGEPLLHTELEDFIQKVRDLGYKVKLDTNGSFPERLTELVVGGMVDYVAMDIKNSWVKYRFTTGKDTIDVADIKDSIQFLMQRRIPYEFRTTVVRELHTVADIEAIAQVIQGADAYYIQNFMDSGNVIGTGLSSVDPDTLASMKQRATMYVRRCEIR